jgi:WS/DGAT/MGAT family acyltransferase
LDVAARFACTPLPRDRPLWAARWVTGLPDGAAALVLVVHHCIADGLGGLAVLAALADGGRDLPADDFPREPPTMRDLFTEAWRQRARGLRRTGMRLRRSSAGLRELFGERHRPRLVARTSLNRPTGPSRRLTTVSLPLSPLAETAHTRGCTVNDVLLTAVAGAMGEVLRARGELVTEIVASVPISSRRATTVERLGNETGVLPLTLPLVTDTSERLRRIALVTKARRTASRGSSAGPLGLAFRSLAAVGAFKAMIEHQRLVHTFVTNVRGPAEALSLAGHRVTSVVPIAITPGNVGVSFDILSYAGTLVLTVVADPGVVPEQDALTAAIERELASLLA